VGRKPPGCPKECFSAFQAGTLKNDAAASKIRVASLTNRRPSNHAILKYGPAQNESTIFGKTISNIPKTAFFDLQFTSPLFREQVVSHC
jgi:hypothetical protein